MELYRCFDCKRLTLDVFLKSGEPCKCGSRRVQGASPSNLIESLIVLWWELTVRES